MKVRSELVDLQVTVVTVVNKSNPELNYRHSLKLFRCKRISRISTDAPIKSKNQQILEAFFCLFYI